MNIEIDEITAHVILGALSLCYSEGTNQISLEFCKANCKKIILAEVDLIKKIQINFPEVAKLYYLDWLDDYLKQAETYVF